MIKQFALDHFNEPMIAIIDVCRMVGYCEDDNDCYYILKYPYDGGVRHPYIKFSAVGCPFILNNFMDSKEYESLDRILSLNGCKPEEYFLETI